MRFLCSHKPALSLALRALNVHLFKSECASKRTYPCLCRMLPPARSCARNRFFPFAGCQGVHFIHHLTQKAHQPQLPSNSTWQPEIVQHARRRARSWRATRRGAPPQWARWLSQTCAPAPPAPASTLPRWALSISSHCCMSAISCHRL